MADLEIHCQDCKLLTGNEFREIHKWLDELANGSPEHRKVRHSLSGIHQVVEKWGGKAGIAALVHILRDKEGYRPIMAEIEEVMKQGIPEFDWSK